MTGGFAKLVRVPTANLLEIPDSVSMEAAAMLEPMSVAMHKSIRMVLNDGFLTGRTASGRALSSNASAGMRRWYRP